MQFLYKFEAMSTPCELLLFEKHKHKADEVAQQVLKEVKRLEKKYNYFDPASYLGALNRREVSQLDTETFSLLQRALLYYSKTNHIFDITIGTIKDIYKISKSIESLEKEKARLLPYVGCEHIRLKKKKLYFDNAYTKIDLGGFVKEYAVDRAALLLKKRQVLSGLINFGGDIFAVGRKPNGEKFKIGIKDPHDPKTFNCFIEIENEALTTSASYERHQYIEEKKFSHIIAKTEAEKVAHSVSVISSNCVESGVFSTALMADPTIFTEHRVILL